MHTDKIDKEQAEVCTRMGAKHLECPLDYKVGIARNVLDKMQPLNGLRHPPAGDTTGWYIWAGEEFSNDPYFFLPLHVEHLAECCPAVLKYLGLPPGWRFLIDDKGYEDIWFDSELLNV